MATDPHVRLPGVPNVSRSRRLDPRNGRGVFSRLLTAAAQKRASSVRGQSRSRRPQSMADCAAEGTETQPALSNPRPRPVSGR